jgi:hypothetical protein
MLWSDNPATIEKEETMSQKVPSAGESHFLLTFFWRLQKK